MKEPVIWKDIPGFEGLYRLNSRGEVYNLVEMKYEIVYIFCKRPKVHLYKDGVRYSKKFDRLVLDTFLGPSRMAISYRDGNPKNCRLNNLFYTTFKDDKKSAKGLKAPAEK